MKPEDIRVTMVITVVRPVIDCHEIRFDTPETSLNDIILYSIRSDLGDGGWSLHTDDQLSTAKDLEEPAELITSGPSERGANGEWSRPNTKDFAEAIAKLLSSE